MKKLVAVTALSLLMGCAGSKALVVKNFEPTGSVCWDALIVNQHVAGCKLASIEQISEYRLKITCEEYADDADPASPWLIYDFFLLTKGGGGEVDATPMCFDQTLVLGWSQKFDPSEGEH